MSYLLFLDDVESRVFATKFPEEIEKLNLEKKLVKDYDAFVAAIQLYDLPQVVSFDNDLHKSHYIEGKKSNFTKFDPNLFTVKTGYHCAEFLVNFCRNRNVPFPIYFIHSQNLGARIKIRRLINGYEEEYNKKNVINK